MLGGPINQQCQCPSSQVASQCPAQAADDESSKTSERTLDKSLPPPALRCPFAHFLLCLAKHLWTGRGFTVILTQLRCLSLEEDPRIAASLALPVGEAVHA